MDEVQNVEQTPNIDLLRTGSDIFGDLMAAAKKHYEDVQSAPQGLSTKDVDEVFEKLCPPDADVTEWMVRLIDCMRHENTGVALCDSGGYAGRGYQQPFPPYPRPRVTIDQWGIVSGDTSYYLAYALQRDPDCLDLQRDFEEYASREENEDESWLGLMVGWTEDRVEDGLLDGTWDTVNTYNGDCDLDCTLQYKSFEYQRNNFVLLQTHNGADARGGYSKPRIFRTNEYIDPCPISYGVWAPIELLTEKGASTLKMIEKLREEHPKAMDDATISKFPADAKTASFERTFWTQYDLEKNPLAKVVKIGEDKYQWRYPYLEDEDGNVLFEGFEVDCYMED